MTNLVHLFKPVVGIDELERRLNQNVKCLVQHLGFKGTSLQVAITKKRLVQGYYLKYGNVDRVLEDLSQLNISQMCHVINQTQLHDTID